MYYRPYIWKKWFGLWNYFNCLLQTEEDLLIIWKEDAMNILYWKLQFLRSFTDYVPSEKGFPKIFDAKITWSFLGKHFKDILSIKGIHSVGGFGWYCKFFYQRSCIKRRYFKSLFFLIERRLFEGPLPKVDLVKAFLSGLISKGGPKSFLLKGDFLTLFGRRRTLWRPS